MQITQMSQHLKLIALSGRCNTNSAIFLKWCQIFFKHCSLALHTQTKKRKLPIACYFLSLFFFFLYFYFIFSQISPHSNWTHVCLGWKKESALQSLCSLQTESGIGHININMQRYCQNISLHGLWFRTGWLESDRNWRIYVYSGLFSAVFRAELLGVNQKYFTSVFLRSSPWLLGFIIISLAWMRLTVCLAYPF